MSNVLHGTGKPRFVAITDTIEYGTVVTATASSVTINLTNYSTLQSLDEDKGLYGLLIYTVNADNEETAGAVIGYAESTSIAIIRYWTNGLPKDNANYTARNYVIDLPYCQKLTERWTPDMVIRKRLNGKIRTKKKGFYYSATLDYSRYIGADTLSILRPLFSTNTKSILFYPRVDNSKIFYVVDISPDTAFELYRLQNHQGHGGFMIEIIGLDRIPEPMMYNPLLVTEGYGYNYGTDYGIGL
jgi:hypothetical protein